MRDELVLPVKYSEASSEHSEGSLLPILCFCSIGVTVTLCFVLSKQSFDQLPLLVAQYNLFG